MKRTPSRRELLGAFGTALAGTAAGCSSTTDPGGSPSSTRAAAQELPQADGSAYTDVYRETIDSVAKLEVYGFGASGQGSAFVYEDDYLITNHHVVDGASAIDVQYADNDWSAAEVVATDAHTDLGVVEADDLPDYATPLPLSETEPVVGQAVMALGNPLGFDSSVSSGIVSGTNRSLSAQTGYSIPNAIQTDAALNPGNSGGPLVNLDADVVAVINSGGGDNLGFGISSAIVRRVVPALIEDGDVQHSRVGIRTYPVDRRVAMANDMEEVRGVFVSQVDDGGPADGVLQGQTGTESVGPRRVPVGGDVIVAIDGTPIPTNNQLSTVLMLQTRPGDTVTVTVVRDGEERDVELTLGSRTD